MNTPSQRTADAINKIRLDSAVWALRAVIDESLALLENKNCTAPEMRCLLEYGQSISENLIDVNYVCRIYSK